MLRTQNPGICIHRPVSPEVRRMSLYNLSGGARDIVLRKLEKKKEKKKSTMPTKTASRVKNHSVRLRRFSQNWSHVFLKECFLGFVNILFGIFFD